ncbi:ferredoxin [Dactylosporangium sp. CA-092794]|uniref:ferredoxin n=1 Tax=Dactylosporangium sp. CA-092794 TaxID=3239929 RepID=UPI003D8CB0EF
MTAQRRRVIVDRDVCVGSGWCVNLAAAAFEIDPVDGKARVQASAGGTPDELEEALDSCPVSAISFAGGTE